MLATNQSSRVFICIALKWPELRDIRKARLPASKKEALAPPVGATRMKAIAENSPASIQ